MNGQQLQAGYDRLKRGTLWSSTGRCKGFAAANPGEAAKIDAYVAAIAAGKTPAPPILTTDTGNGLVQMLAALTTTPPPPALKVTLDPGAARQGGVGTGQIVAA